MHSVTENEAIANDYQDFYVVGEGIGSQNNPQRESADRKEEPWFVEISSFDDERYEIKKSITAQITRENNEYRVEVPETETYAFDECVEDALIEVVAELVQLCDEILDLSDENLGTAPKQWKQFLLDHVKGNG